MTSLLSKIVFLVVLTACFGCSDRSLDPTQVDFDAALHSLNFNGEDDGNGSAGGNGIPDGAEMALLTAILQDNTLDLSPQGGVTYTAVRQAYEASLLSLHSDLGALLIAWPLADQAIAGYVLLGDDSFTTINRMSSSFGAPLKGDYSTALALDNYLSASGDADGDGFSNYEEYLASENESVDSYVTAALDPDQSPSGEQRAQHAPASQRVMTVGVVLYPGFEVLDVYGPVEIWSYVPNLRIVLIAEQAGPVLSGQGTSTVATHSFETAPPLDVLMVPGGNGTRGELHNTALLEYLVQANQASKYTTSVCTGSALLARAGILDGHRATTNKRAFYLAEQQSAAVDWVVEARWVRSGKMFTSSGVSAGTDMALAFVAELHGIEAASEIAHSLEYSWHADGDSDPFAVFANRLPKASSEEYTLVKSEPETNQIVSVSPRYLRLYFSNIPDVANSTITLSLVDNEGKKIGLSGMHTMGNADLMLRIDDPLPAGRYSVSWRVQFQDSTAAREGEYEFQLATATADK